MRIRYRTCGFAAIAAFQSICLVAAVTAQDAVPRPEPSAEEAEAIKWVAQSGGSFRRGVSQRRFSVENVNLNRLPVVDADLARLAVLVDLETIGLAETQVRGECLASFSKLPRLRCLMLGGPRFDPQHLKQLASFPALDELRMTGTSITSDSLAALERLPLTGLYLDKTAIDDHACPRLATLTDLTVLYLTGSKVTDAGIERLTSLKKLQAIYLNGTEITDEAVTTLLKFPELRLVGVGNTQVTSVGLEQLKNSAPKLLVR